MLTITSKFFFGVFIGFALGLLLNAILCNGRPNNTGALIQTIKLQSITKLSATNKIYSPEFEKLWNDLITIIQQKNKFYPKFLFIEMTSEIYKLPDKQKATATITNFYLRRINPREKTRETIQCWINEEDKKNVNYEAEDINDSDSIINNSNGKKDNSV